MKYHEVRNIGKHGFHRLFIIFCCFFMKKRNSITVAVLYGAPFVSKLLEVAVYIYISLVVYIKYSRINTAGDI